MRSLTGTWALAKLAFRREVGLLCGFAALVAGLLAATARSFQDTYELPESRLAYSQAIAASPVQLFFNGPGAGSETIGGIVVFEIGGYLLVAAALLAIPCVVRHSRALESNGIAELARGGRVGVHALGAAAAIVAIALSLAWGLAATLALGCSGLGWAGAACYGLELASAGALSATVAGLACQLVTQPRTATLIAGGVLAVSFIIRGVGDMRASWLTWLSPLGWAQASRPFGQERLWPFAVVAAAVAAGQAVSWRLAARRDLGAGTLPERAGRTRAPAWLRSLPGLSWTQLWPLARGWWAAIAGLALAFGFVSQEFAEAGGAIDMTAFFGPASDPVTGLVRFCSLLLALLSAAAGVAALALAGQEESSGRLDAILATRVGRVRWAAGQSLGALASSGIGLVLAGSCMSLAIRWSGIDKPLWDSFSPLLAYLPATWLIVALAQALFGWRHRARPVAWLALAWCAIAGLFGTILRLPEWAQDLSPFAHVPDVPADPLLGWPVVVLLVLSVALAGLGIGLIRRRDLGG